MGGGFHDALVIGRCTGMAVGIGGVARYILVAGPGVVRHFDATVKPLIEASLAADPVLCQDTYDALLATAVRVGLAMHGYATMARLEFDGPLSVLGGAFTRVYDDLFDHFYLDGLDDRLSALFRGAPFHPQSGPEALAGAMFRTIVERMGRAGDDPFFSYVCRLHSFQCASRRQLDPLVSAEEVRHITRGKGGHGVQSLFALLRPGLAGSEADLAMELGHLLQLIDDHHDMAVDRRQGVVTSATRGESTLASLAAQIRLLRTGLHRHYGRGRDRQLAAMLYVMLLGVYQAHHLQDQPSSGPVAGHPKASVWHLMFKEAGHMAAR